MTLIIQQNNHNNNFTFLFMESQSYILTILKVGKYSSNDLYADAISLICCYDIVELGRFSTFSAY